MGTVTASLILGKLASYPRQNGLAQALRELGRIERTLFTLEWIQSPDLRQRATISLAFCTLLQICNLPPQVISDSELRDTCSWVARR